MSELICRKLSLGYDGNVIAEGVDFTVNKGDYLCIIGENGSGKSTLIKTILNLMKPMAGELILGMSYKEIGYMPQQTEIQRDFPASIREIVMTGMLSLFGTTLVLKRLSFIGDGLSHVVFGAMAIAAVAGVTNDMTVILPVTVLSAVGLLSLGQNSKIKGDAAAMISVSSLALGYMLLNIFSVSGNVSGDVCTSLFGSTSIMTLSITDVILCTVLSLIVVVLFIFFYNKIFAVTFDEKFARATGIHAKLYNFLVAVIIAVIIVLAMKLVGTLLISALIIFPPLSAMRVFKSFRSVIISSALSSVICAVLGILISVLTGTPVGSTVVAADAVIFILFSLAGLLFRKRNGASSL